MGHQLISIITPFKNTAEYLSDCLNSIVNQTYQNWELLIVDDGSTDNSFGIVQSYADRDHRIHLLKNLGQGIIPALQTAYAASSGDFITRMDSDDIMHLQKLEKLNDMLNDRGPGHVAVGQVTYFSEIGISDGYAKYEAWLNGLTSKGDNFTELYKECSIPSPCWMVFREDFEKCGGFDYNQYPEDYDLTFRFYQGGLSCIPCSEVLHLWRDYPTRTSRTHVHYAQNYFLDLKFDYFKKLHFNSTRPLVIWGAGNKGKHLAKLFIDNAIPFTWMCDNPNKINKDIYGKNMIHFNAIDQMSRPQIIVTVANQDAQHDIRQFMTTRSLKQQADYFFFC